MPISGKVFIATSLDGFIAREDHSIDWLMNQPEDPEDRSFHEFMETVDGLVMGSNSFRTVLGFKQWIYNKPVVVLSKSLSKADIPDWITGDVEISNLDVESLVSSLEARGWSSVYIDGGAVIQSFLKAGYIEEITITKIPVLIGSGIPLFGEIESDIQLELISSKSTGAGFVQTKYKVVGE